MFSRELSAVGPGASLPFPAPGTLRGSPEASSLGLDSGPFGLLLISLPSGRAFPSSVVFGNSLNHTVTQSNASGKPGTTQTPGNTAVAPDWPFSANSSTALERRSGWGERLGRI